MKNQQIRVDVRLVKNFNKYENYEKFVFKINVVYQ